MRRRMILVAVAALLVAPVPAADAATPLIDARDPRGDVRFTHAAGLTDQQRRSVDLGRLVATPTEDGLHLKLRLRRVATDAPFDQYFFVTMLGSQFGSVQVRAARLRGWAGLEGAPTPGGFAGCRLSPKVDLRNTRLTVFVPRRCVPEDEVEVSVSAYTTPLGRRGGQVIYSRDQMRVPGTLDLTPAS